MMKETLERLKTESPDYFKKIRTVALALGGAAVAMITINSTLSLGINGTLMIICQYTAFICAGIAGTATLTKV